MKKKNSDIIIFAIYIIIAFASSIVLFFLNKCSEKIIVSLLPLGYVIVSFFNYRIFDDIFHHPARLIAATLFLLRMSICPVLYAMVAQELHSQYLDQAILLMIYEYACVAFVFNIMTKKCCGHIKKQENTTTKMSLLNNKYLIFFTTILLIVVIILLLSYPQLVYYFASPFVSNREIIDQNNIQFYNMRIAVPSSYYWIFVFIVGILQVIIPIVLLNFIRKKVHSDKMGIFLSMIVVVLTLLIATPERARSFIIAIAEIFTILKLYPKNGKRIVIFMGSCLIIAIFIALVIKSSNSFDLSSIAYMMQVYFSGFTNVATSLAMPSGFHIGILFNDIVTSIPFLSSISKDLITTPFVFNLAFYDKLSISEADQIIPMIGQARYYFGTIISPLLSVIVGYIACKLEKKTKKSLDTPTFYLYNFIIIYMASSPVLYNGTIILQTTLSVFLPCFIMINISKKMSEKEKRTLI